MPELLVTPVPPESEQAAALRDEQARLEQTRARFNKGYLIEIGAWCLILFGYQLSQNQPGSIYVLLPGLGLALSMVGAGMDAVARGRHPAWGVLSLFAGLILQLLPDLIAKRLDEIELALTGKLGSHVANDRRHLAMLVVIVLISGVVRQYNRNQVSNPSTQPSTADFVEGRHSRVQLPAGWRQAQTDRLKADYAVAGPAGVVLTIWEPTPKANFPDDTFDDFALRLESLTQRDGAWKSTAGVPPALLGGRSGYALEFQRKEQDGSRTGQLVCIWDTKSHYWVTVAVLAADSIDARRREIHQLVGSIQTKHE